MEDHDKGLAFDLERLVGRRTALGVLGGGVLAVLAGCGSGDPATPASGAASAGGPATAATTAAAAGCAEAVPAETAGPFPADGSNGPNVLTQSGVVRADLTRSFGEYSGTAEGVPLTIELTVRKSGGSCAPYPGAAVYLWHCDRAGAYSLYSDAAADQNYLRGVQSADPAGKLAFTSIFPACYDGRWPHAHFEVYPSLAAATKAEGRLVTSQLALPEDACDAVYATPGYERSVQALSRVTLDSDGIFSDGHSTQLATLTGTPATGYKATLTITV